MIIKEKIIINNIEYLKIYSDKNYYILNDNGVKYASIINLPYLNKEYTETSELIPIYPERMSKNVSGE